MTALTEDKQIELMEGKEKDFPVAASQKIFGGALCCVNAAGYALEGSDTAGLIFEGVAMSQVDNSSGSNGDLDIVLRRKGLVRVKCNSTATQANVGDKMYLVDDQTVDLIANTTNDILAGICAGFISSTDIWLDIEPAVNQA